MDFAQNDAERAATQLGRQFADWWKTRDEGVRAEKVLSAATLARFAETGLTRLGFEGGAAGEGAPAGARAAALVEVATVDASAAVVFAWSVEIGARLLHEYGAPALKRKHLAPLLSGEGTASVAHVEVGHLDEPFAIRATAAREGDGFVLSGRKTFVPHGDRADCFFVTARIGGDEPGVFFVLAEEAGVHSSTRLAIDGLAGVSFAHIEFDKVKLAPDRLLGGAKCAEAVARLEMLNRFAITSLTTGVIVANVERVRALLDGETYRGKQYARRQEAHFPVADMQVAADGARLATARLAWMLEKHPLGGDPRADGDALFAGGVEEFADGLQLYMLEQAAAMTEKAIEIFGGPALAHGHPLAQLYRDARALALLGRERNDLRDRLAERALQMFNS